MFERTDRRVVTHVTRREAGKTTQNRYENVAQSNHKYN